MSNEKTEKLSSKLMMKREHFSVSHAGEVEAADAYCEGYKAFLNAAKTERECADWFSKKAEEAGFEPFDPKKTYAPGSKVYLNNRGKAVILARIGTESLEKGVRIVASHIDAPRLDLKPVPLYEENEIAYFKTHYYGGIRKYQCVTIPLSLHGVIIRADSSKVNVRLGEEEGEPRFVLTDLLPHLSKEQNKRTLPEGIKGEEMNVLIGSRPFADDEESEKTKLNVLDLLYKKYGVTEDDFVSAELEVVPAFKAEDIGFDRSMIGAYGHDDRVCAYPGFTALLDAEKTDKTAVMVLADKEEIGSEGNTGLNSNYLMYFIADLAKSQGLEPRHVLSASSCLSADVTAAYDPTFSSPFEKLNATFINHGTAFAKYTGARGKSGTNDAGAEYVAEIRSIMDGANVHWQIGELGKVDEGGGGTVAMYISKLNVNVIDIGVPVLSMHSPYEVVAKSDVYSTYRACRAFFEA